MLDRCSCTTPSLNTALINLAAALNVFPLSDTNLRGIPLLAANRLRHLMNVSVDMSVTMSRRTAQVMQQVKRQIHNIPHSQDLTKLRSFTIQNFVGHSQAKGTYVEWTGKVNTCEQKWWFLSDSELGQRWRWWSAACRSLKSPTYHTMIDYGSHQTSTFHNPELCPYLCQGLLDSVVPYTIMCLSDNHRRQRMSSWK